jgi:hypothetical protein
MITTIRILSIFVWVILLTGCNLVDDSPTYKQKTAVFVETLIKEEYDKCLALLATDHKLVNVNPDTIKKHLSLLRASIADNWGTQLEYSMIRSEKKISAVLAENRPPNTTLVLVGFNNKQEFGILRVLFDDESGKILSINILDEKHQIPSRTYIWIFGLISACVLFFNTYVIVRILRSTTNRRWLKSLAVAFLNIPAISYSILDGISFHVLHFQFMGISFAHKDLLSTQLMFGIPLAALYWFWKLR